MKEDSSITTLEKRSEGKLLPLLYSSRPDDGSMNNQNNLKEEKLTNEEKTFDEKEINDNTNRFGDSWWPSTTEDVKEDDSELWWPTATKNAEEDDSQSWWPSTTNDIQEDDSESWWPTNPIVIESLEAKSPGVTDWSFLDSEYLDPLDNKEIQKIPLINITSLPRYSTSNINDTQINMLRSARKSDIDVQKVSSRRGSLTMIEMIKEMTM